MASYIPLEDLPCLAWLNQFSGVISSNPGAFFMSEADAASVADKVADFQAALALSNGADTRSPNTILLKDQKKAIAVQLARTFARLIKPNGGISDANKQAAGVPLPRTGGGTPIGPPTNVPLLEVVGATYQSHTLKYRDPESDRPRAKPYGVTGLQLLMTIADGPVSDSDEARIVGVYTRTPLGIAFEPSQNGKVATYWAAWVNPRQQRGPLTAPVSLTIAA